MKIGFVLIVTLFFASLNASEDIKLKALKISSTLIEIDEIRSSDAVEVYTSKDIEQTHVQNIYEFLNTHTSVVALPALGNPYAQKLDIHGYGIYNGHQNIVVMINGRKINNIDMATTLLYSILPSSIDTIEIIKSSGIVTSGDGANGGVISIKTKQDTKQEYAFSLETQSTHDATVYVGHASKNLSVAVTGEHRKSNGIRAIGSNGENDANAISTGTLDLTIKPVEAIEIKYTATSTKADVVEAGTISKDQYDTNPKQISSSYKQESLDLKSFSGTATVKLGNNLRLKAGANRQRKRSAFNIVLPSSESTLDYDYLYEGFDGRVDYMSKIIDISFGGSRSFNTRKSDNNITKDNFTIFGATQIHYMKSTLKGGAIYEEVVYDFKDGALQRDGKYRISGLELGYNYALNHEASFYSNYAHSYQLPDVDRLLKNGSFKGFIYPMISDSLTVGLNYITSMNKLKLSAYLVLLNGEIYNYSDTNTSTNIDISYKYGVDLYDKVIFSEVFDMVLNYNYVQAAIFKEIGENGENYRWNTFPGVSSHSTRATLSYKPNKNARFAITETYRSEAYAANDFENNFAQKQEAFSSTDFSASYTDTNYEVFLKVNNIFNNKNGLWIADDQIYPVNFTRTAMAGLKLKY